MILFHPFLCVSCFASDRFLACDNEGLRRCGGAASVRQLPEVRQLTVVKGAIVDFWQYVDICLFSVEIWNLSWRSCASSTFGLFLSLVFLMLTYAILLFCSSILIICNDLWNKTPATNLLYIGGWLASIVNHTKEWDWCSFSLWQWE